MEYGLLIPKVLHGQHAKVEHGRPMSPRPPAARSKLTASSRQRSEAEATALSLPNVDEHRRLVVREDNAPHRWRWQPRQSRPFSPRPAKRSAPGNTFPKTGTFGFSGCSADEDVLAGLTWNRRPAFLVAQQLHDDPVAPSKATEVVDLAGLRGQDFEAFAKSFGSESTQASLSDEVRLLAVAEVCSELRWSKTQKRPVFRKGTKGALSERSLALHNLMAESFYDPTLPRVGCSLVLDPSLHFDSLGVLESW